MTDRRLLSIIAVFVIVLATIGNTCGGTGGGGSSSGVSGFAIRTVEIGESIFGYALSSWSPGIYVTGNRQYDLPGATGSVILIPGVYTDVFGYKFIESGRAPANWRFAEGNGPCAGMTSINSKDAYPGSEIEVECIHGGGSSFGINPTTINGVGPPSSISLTGSGVDATYGTPQVWVFNDIGAVMYTTTVDGMSPDGTWVCFSGLPALYTGTYVVLIRNVQADGTVLTVGGAQMDVYGNDPPPPPPPPDPIECTNHVCPIDG
jgi:hypothetical protein